MYKELKTPCGVIKGIIEDDILKFKGIRYATSERWKYPTLVTKWDGVLEAYEYGPCCYQRRAFVDEEKETIADLLLMDDDTMLLSEGLLQGLDEELDAFLKDLLEN